MFPFLLSLLTLLRSYSVRAGRGREIQSSRLYPSFKECLDWEVDLPNAAQLVNGTVRRAVRCPSSRPPSLGKADALWWHHVVWTLMLV